LAVDEFLREGGHLSALVQLFAVPPEFRFSHIRILLRRFQFIPYSHLPIRPSYQIVHPTRLGIQKIDELNSAHEELHVGPQLPAHSFAAVLASAGSWHFLYFLPLPHQQGSFLPGRTCGTRSSLLLNRAPIFSKIPISCDLPF